MWFIELLDLQELHYLSYPKEQTQIIFMPTINQFMQVHFQFFFVSQQTNLFPQYPLLDRAL